MLQSLIICYMVISYSAYPVIMSRKAHVLGWTPTEVGAGWVMAPVLGLVVGIPWLIEEVGAYLSGSRKS